ncbi:uncharacterized protein LOC141915442 [Tubulanus polymorphus]|uniref:uncharacterized protein LOC141915442 n=1 Tax=Tubulanus polymorphus TaxID=672921 RepID=UPI003DA5E94E
MAALLIRNMNWNKYITEKLLKKGLLNGVCLTSPHGHCLYEYGILSNTGTENDWSLFSRAFPDPDAALMNGFEISLNYNYTGTLMNNRLYKQKYKVYKQTYCSMYATVVGGYDGLIVCKLPYGLLICTFFGGLNSPHSVVKEVESFCDKLRA